MGYPDLRVRLVHDARVRALKKNLHFSLEVHHIKIPKFCPVLGIPIFQGKGRPGPNSPTIDRIDNELGYVPWNICVISYKANMLKSNGTLEEFQAIVRYLEAKSPNVPHGTLDTEAYNFPDGQAKGEYAAAGSCQLLDSSH